MTIDENKPDLRRLKRVEKTMAAEPHAKILGQLTNDSLWLSLRVLHKKVKEIWEGADNANLNYRWVHRLYRNMGKFLLIADSELNDPERAFLSEMGGENAILQILRVAYECLFQANEAYREDEDNCFLTDFEHDDLAKGVMRVLYIFSVEDLAPANLPRLEKLSKDMNRLLCTYAYRGDPQGLTEDTLDSW